MAKKKKYVPLRVRPLDATPEEAVRLHEHLTLQEIANRWGISKNAVWLLIQKTKPKKDQVPNGQS